MYCRVLCAPLLFTIACLQIRFLQRSHRRVFTCARFTYARRARDTAHLRLLEGLFAPFSSSTEAPTELKLQQVGSAFSDTDADSDAEAPSRTWLTVRFDDPLVPPACARVQPLSSRHALPLRLRSLRSAGLSSTFWLQYVWCDPAKDFQFSQSANYPKEINVVAL